MSTKLIDGVEYILKSSVETIIKDRVSKVAARASSAEHMVTQLETQLTEMSQSAGSVETLNSQITDLQNQLNQSNQKYTRFQSISKHGLSDPRMVAAIEWSYDYEQQRLPEESKQSLSDWLDHQVANPSEAPVILRPHLKALNKTATPITQSESAPPAQVAPPAPPAPPVATPAPIPPPSTNRGAIPSPDESNFWQEAASNPKFYEANREEIRARINSKRRQ